MAKSHRKQSGKAGLPPGTLVHVGEKRMEEAVITCLDYDEKNLYDKRISDAEECKQFKESATTSWINIDSINNVGLIEQIGKAFQLHPLVLEDILHTSQRPKLEDFDNYLYIVVKMLSYNDTDQVVETEQVSIVLGPNYVISFQEHAGDVFEKIRERIRTAKGRIRKMGVDYLAYALIDAIVDNYFVIIEKLGEKIESLEETLVSHPTDDVLKDIHSLKRQMISLRKSVSHQGINVCISAGCL